MLLLAFILPDHITEIAWLLTLAVSEIPALNKAVMAADVFFLWLLLGLSLYCLPGIGDEEVAKMSPSFLYHSLHLHMTLFYWWLVKGYCWLSWLQKHNLMAPLELVLSADSLRAGISFPYVSADLVFWMVAFPSWRFWEVLTLLYHRFTISLRCRYS